MFLACRRLSVLRKVVMRDLMFAVAAVGLSATMAVTLPARNDRLAEGPGDAPDCAWRTPSGETTTGCAP